MDEQFLSDHILGSIVNAMIGDAMGSANENFTREQTLERFGGQIEKFYEPMPGTFAAGRQAGQITDDTSLLIEMALAEIESCGILKIEKVVEHIISWSHNLEMFGHFSGPTSQKAIQLLQNGENPYKTGLPTFSSPMSGVSNGAAMKAAPAGLAHAGNIDAAIVDAVTICIPTHSTNIAFAGASAVAAGVAEALRPGATILSILDATIYGAENGQKVGEKFGVVVSGPSVVERIRLAATIAVGEANFTDACIKVSKLIGSGLHTAEAVPAAIGAFLAARGDPNLSVIGAVNMGGDTDTVATIAGAISGAYSGIRAINTKLSAEVQEINLFDLQPIVNGLTKLSISEKMK